MSRELIEAASRSPLFVSHEEISLYLHVPFCAHKCGYCDFYSKASRSGIDKFLDSFQKEVDLYLRIHPELKAKTITTIFVGGGTPSILTESEWIPFAAKVTASFQLAADCEWTIEVNPESFTDAKAKAWLRSGVNRLSFGVQSLNDSVLKRAERIHSAQRVIDLLNNPILTEFDRISCDTIYGLPGQTVSDVKETLTKLLSFPVVTHISAYELTIAEDTPFAALAPSLFPDEEGLADYESAVLELLTEAGFERYEVSNYAKPGKQCRHNQNYWTMKPYLGLGPSAHSFDGEKRFGDVGSLNQYGQLIDAGSIPWGFFESVTPEMYLTEYLFLALRTANGIEFDRWEQLFGEPLLFSDRRQVIDELCRQDLAIIDRGRFALTPRGLNLADGVANRLL